MAGRAHMYGLGAAGERGVDHVLELMRSGMERTMALVGSATVADLDPSLLGSHGEAGAAARAARLLAVTEAHAGRRQAGGRRVLLWFQDFFDFG